MTSLQRAGCVSLMVEMLKCDHVIMQNEALVALTLLTSLCLGSQPTSVVQVTATGA